MFFTAVSVPGKRTDTAVSLDFEWQGEKYAVELAPHDSRVIVKE